ncbi:hypothetical protein MSM1_02265 [Mycobacterium sp. SM1]|uniref:hypothetical protein n=1 Tax=Mycobacterium sp. SM1 TaxID=2816243 RepID=UPI001BCE2811|nr:hypothetical protein [Mycobacterium sp. SM1]MBS4727233.1 hypothetical protein [Mycobacterium sp. SM1]
MLAGVVAVGVLAWVLSGGAPTDQRSGEGCVTIAFPSTMGGGIERACGAAAHDWCRAAGARRDAHAAAIQAQCRVAGIRP